MKAQRIKNVCVSAMAVAILAICSQICFPLPSAVAVTLQTAAVAFCGYYLGAKRSVAAISAYILLGVVGVPVFSGLSGGIAVLFSASGGFIIGFVPLALFCSAYKENGKFSLSFVMGLLGLLICHIFGITAFSLLTKTSLAVSFISVSLPFIIKDIMSVLFALCLSRRIPAI